MDLGGPVSEHSSGEERRKDEMGRRVLIRKPYSIDIYYIYMSQLIIGLGFILFYLLCGVPLSWAMPI